MDHMTEFAARFSHPGEYPKECVDKLLELLASRRLRTEWKTALPCILTVAAYLASKILNAEPDKPILFGSYETIPAGLLALDRALDGDNRLNASLPAAGNVIVQLVLRRILAELIEMLKSVTAEDILDWINGL